MLMTIQSHKAGLEILNPYILSSFQHIYLNRKPCVKILLLIQYSTSYSYWCIISCMRASFSRLAL